MKKAALRNASLLKAEGLLNQIQTLARVVLLFPFVVDVESCAAVPILLGRTFHLLQKELHEILGNPNTRVAIGPETLFYGIMDLLSKDGGYSVRTKEGFDADGLFLCSDFGWRVFLDTVGDKDPYSNRCPN